MVKNSLFFCNERKNITIMKRNAMPNDFKFQSTSPTGTSLEDKCWLLRTRLVVKAVTDFSPMLFLQVEYFQVLKRDLGDA